jgi:hypothetical protein
MIYYWVSDQGIEVYFSDWLGWLQKAGAMPLLDNVGR